MAPVPDGKPDCWGGACARRRDKYVRAPAFRVLLRQRLHGLLIWWLDNDVPYWAEELYAIFRRLTTQGVRRFLTT